MPAECRCAVKRPSRPGFLTIELVVAAGMMLTVITVVTTLSFRVRGVLVDTREHHQALWALASEMERLTALPSAEAIAAVEALQPSPELLATLPGAQWSAQLQNDADGERIELELNWNRRHQGKPLRLVGWLLPQITPQSTPPVADAEETP